MRIPFPIRIPLSHSCAFAVALCVAQFLEGTSLLFSLYSFAFILIATVAFNLADGFSRPSGSYVFFYAVLAVIVGLVYKVYLGERADSNLIVPEKTMQVYVGGISAMLLAVFLKKLVLPAKSLLGGRADRVDLKAASVGCVSLGIAIYVLSVVFIKAGATAEENYANRSGTILSALQQVNYFLPLGLILGVTHEIKSSGGKRFLNTTVVVGFVFFVLTFGILNVSKGGLFLPVACVMIAAAALGYKFSLGQTVAFLLAMVFAFYYLVPYVQVGKSFVAAPTYWGQVKNAWTLLSDLEGNRAKLNEDAPSYEEEDDFAIHYFNSRQGAFDRLQMISVDDALIDVTEQGHVFGLSPLLFDVYNLVPHFIWPDKPLIALGNIYSHEITHSHYSSRGEEDTTTGISFSPTADAFHMARWAGVLLVAPALWFCCFFAIDFVCGDTRRSPWGLLIAALCAHTAPEGMMNGPFFLMTYGPLILLFIAFTSVYILPLIGRVIQGRKQPTSLALAAARGVTARIDQDSNTLDRA
jgi:hypothetical protein